MGRTSRVLVGVAAIALVATACNRGDDASPETTTTTAAPVTTTAATQTTTTTTAAPATNEGETETTLGLPDYQIVRRVTGENGGDTVVVVLDPTSYNELTDLDLQNVIADVVERFPPVLVAHVVDSDAAVEAVLAEEPSEDQTALLETHYFVRLEDGFRMVFVGQFDSVGDVILGS